MAAIQCSTGLRNKLLDTNPFKTIFNLSFLKVYDGPVPASADAALDAANHLLVTISNAGTATGLTFAASASGGAITKTIAETWSGVAIASGTASFYRLVLTGDTGALSTTDARVQGLINTSGAALNLTTITIVNANSYPVDAFSIAIPTT